MILFDSNILIGYLNGDKVIIEKLQKHKADRQILFVSAITVTEILALASLTHSEIRIIESFLKDFVILPITSDIAKQAAVLKRTYKLSVPDALIASTAILHSLHFMTADLQLQKVPHLKHLV